ncbi:major facilitator superfamily domain-containing protein [Chaetomium fimeti]|uniref:Major facilitator superfamily domain-containing protein n=1 Tax=Chaetomium fimeti TaxID=1854472 RepID=A0AAE0HGC9_9PEZI|nr:major facilitator superfamily domain-containing protein [Chaetomium fimeti]
MTAVDDDARALLVPGRCDIREYGAVTDIPNSSGHNSASDSESDVQDGVRRIEAVARTWSKWGLVIAYLSIFLMAFTVSLEGQVTYSLAAFAVSSFNNHSLLSTVYVVQGVVNAVIKPPMAKLADVFGRLEAFCISVLLCVLGYIQMAASQNVQTYASAQIFYSAGSTGLQILQQVFIADTSDFLNRALFSSLPDSPFLVTVWIGPAIAAFILANSTWRVGYAIWAVILPIAFLPLALSLFLNGRKAERMGLLTKRRRRNSTGDIDSPRVAAKRLFHDLDVGGTLLLSGGLSLILIPLTLVSRSPSGWHDPKLLLMILIGFVLLILFPFWESRAPHPLLPLQLLKSRTFCAGCALGFFYFAVFYIAVQPYFYSYLLVALNLPVSRAGPITQTFSFASTIAALVASLIIRRLSTPRPRPFILAGAALYTVAITVLLHTRTREASTITLFAAQTMLGAGAGLVHVATQLIVQAAAASTDIHGPGHGHGHPQQYVGVATAAFLTLVQVGAAVGSAVSGAVWGRLVPGKLREYLPEHVRGEADKIYASVVVACSYAWGSPEREAIARSYQETITVLLWVALVACGPVLGMALLVGDYRLDGTGKGVSPEDDRGVEGEEEGEQEGGGEVRVVGETDAPSMWWSKWWSRPKGKTASVSVSSVHS